MAAPRFVNDLQENALWLSLSSLWAVAGTMAWLFSREASISREASSGMSGSGSELTMLALFAAATTLALRMPILSGPPKSRLRSDHAVWLLTSFAAINWLGFLIVQAPAWSDAIPALLLIGSSEAWFHAQAWRCGSLPWLRESCESLAQHAWTWGSEPSVEGQLETADASLPSGVERTTVQGLDEQGRPYLSGRIKVSMAAEESTRTLSIAFSPPFTGDPDVAFECELLADDGKEDELSVYLIHNTPAGMRLGLRRMSSTEAIDFWLQWYAAEVELSDEFSSSAAASALP